MYLAETKTILTEAMRRAFDGAHPVPDFRDIHISIEFPIERQNYPGIWVDFEPSGPLRTAGIGHAEYAVVEGGLEVRHRRWRFQGYASYTVAALSSLERDRLLDEVARVFAASDASLQGVAYRDFIEANPLIAMNIDFDEIEQRGYSSAPGTPWGTDDAVYEGTLAMEVVGEFVTRLDGTLEKITQFNLMPWASHEQVPAWPAGPTLS